MTGSVCHDKEAEDLCRVEIENDCEDTWPKSPCDKNCDDFNHPFREYAGCIDDDQECDCYMFLGPFYHEEIEVCKDTTWT